MGRNWSKENRIPILLRAHSFNYALEFVFACFSARQTRLRAKLSVFSQDCWVNIFACLAIELDVWFFATSFQKPLNVGRRASSEAATGTMLRLASPPKAWSAGPLLIQFYFRMKRHDAREKRKTFTFLFFDRRGARDNEALVTRIWPRWLDYGGASEKRAK